MAKVYMNPNDLQREGDLPDDTRSVLTNCCLPSFRA